MVVPLSGREYRDGIDNNSNQMTSIFFVTEQTSD
jgi:hypothetical protein